MAVKVVFCYAHEDEVLLDKLKSHLKPLQRQNFIELWYDRDIGVPFSCVSESAWVADWFP